MLRILNWQCLEHLLELKAVNLARVRCQQEVYHSKVSRGCRFAQNWSYLCLFRTELIYVCSELIYSFVQNLDYLSLLRMEVIYVCLELNLFMFVQSWSYLWLFITEVILCLFITLKLFMFVRNWSYLCLFITEVIYACSSLKLFIFVYYWSYLCLFRAELIYVCRELTVFVYN